MVIYIRSYPFQYILYYEIEQWNKNKKFKIYSSEYFPQAMENDVSIESIEIYNRMIPKRLI